MKKLLALMLAAALVFSLAACGGDSEAEDTETPSTGNGDTTQSETPSDGGEDSAPEESAMTKEEMLAVAQEGNFYELGKLVKSNKLRAKQEYCGKVLTMKLEQISIEEDSISFYDGKVEVIAYLPEEDILKLESGQVVTIVGLTNDEFETRTTSANGYELEHSVCIMEQAYFVQDTYEYVGIPKRTNNSFSGAWDVEFPNSDNPNYLRLVFFDSSVDVAQYVDKQITFSAKERGRSDLEQIQYYDAVIVDAAE